MPVVTFGILYPLMRIAFPAQTVVKTPAAGIEYVFRPCIYVKRLRGALRQLLFVQYWREDAYGMYAVGADVGHVGRYSRTVTESGYGTRRYIVCCVYHVNQITYGELYVMFAAQTRIAHYAFP